MYLGIECLILIIDARTFLRKKQGIRNANPSLSLPTREKSHLGHGNELQDIQHKTAP